MDTINWHIPFNEAGSLTLYVWYNADTKRTRRTAEKTLLPWDSMVQQLSEIRTGSLRCKCLGGIAEEGEGCQILQGSYWNVARLGWSPCFMYRSTCFSSTQLWLASDWNLRNPRYGFDLLDQIIIIQRIVLFLPLMNPWMSLELVEHHVLACRLLKLRTAITRTHGLQWRLLGSIEFVNATFHLHSYHND